MFNEDIPTQNPYRPKYIHLYHLYTLLFYVIPSIQDSGASLKLNNIERFMLSYRQLYMVILNSSSSLYMRCMLLYYMLFLYWKENNLVVYRMLAANVTFWSEESGEIAISYLAQTQSPSHKADIEVTNFRWLDVRLKYEARNLGLFKRKKERKKSLER